MLVGEKDLVNISFLLLIRPVIMGEDISSGFEDSNWRTWMVNLGLYSFCLLYSCVCLPGTVVTFVKSNLNVFIWRFLIDFQKVYFLCPDTGFLTLLNTWLSLSGLRNVFIFLSTLFYIALLISPPWAHLQLSMVHHHLTSRRQLVEKFMKLLALPCGWVLVALPGVRGPSVCSAFLSPPPIVLLQWTVVSLFLQ